MKKLIIAIALFALSFTYPPEKVSWADDIENPENEPFVVEVAFNLGIEPQDITQMDFCSPTDEFLPKSAGSCCRRIYLQLKGTLETDPVERITKQS